MRVRVRLDGRHPRQWHQRLIERLGVRGCRLEVDARPGPDARPVVADRVCRFETLAFGLAGGGPAAALGAAAVAGWPRPAGAAPDVVIDLCGDAGPDDGVPVRRLLFDGRAGEAALLDSLLAKRVPVASLVEDGRTVAAARLGTEVRGVVATMLDDALARTVTMVAASFAGGAAPLADVPPPHAHQAAPNLWGRVARIAARAAVQRAYRLAYRSPHWRVGWRKLEGPDLITLGDHPATGWRELPDDGLRFYADPFPVVRRDRCWLFVEEFPHATGKGVIAAVPFGPDGPEGVPVPVLETPHHLSYPFVFEQDGAMWMVPECCAGESIDLFRATDFPGGWVRDRTLVADVTASDATLFEHDGRWWMSATVRDAPAGAPLGHGSYSDALCLWSAPDFRGPWTPHSANPVLIDTAAARPAGRVVVRDGTLIRPVQDCAEGYGRALGLMRVDRLDDGGFAQSPVARITAGPLWPGSRIHTLNSAGGFEFIDGSARVPRFLPARLTRRRH